MTIPGFYASASFYGGTNVYRAATLQRSAGAITPAQGSCTCTSPTCTWQCPTPDCTTLGCPRGQFCCDSDDPPTCRLNNPRQQCVCAGGVWTCFHGVCRCNFL
jgi:hypothetical protein